MNINTEIKPVAAVPAPASAEKPVQEQGIEYAELWKVIRSLLVVWAVAVWLLLVMMPGVQQISDAATAILHVPHIFIGLGLIGAIFASYDLRADIHLLWFLVVLLLLAGWM